MKDQALEIPTPWGPLRVGSCVVRPIAVIVLACTGHPVVATLISVDFLSLIGWGVNVPSFERGEMNLTLASLLLLAQTFKIKVEDLFKGSED
jgi:hypothetical protein